MKLTLVAAIRYLEMNALPKNEIIDIDLWGDEGHELQELARQYDGCLTMEGSYEFLFGHENPCKNSQLNCLMFEIGKANLAIQFVSSYPHLNPAKEGNDGVNLRVYVMHVATLQKALRRFDSHQTAPVPVKAAPRALRKRSQGTRAGRDTRLSKIPVKALVAA